MAARTGIKEISKSQAKGGEKMQRMDKIPFEKRVVG